MLRAKAPLAILAAVALAGCALRGPDVASAPAGATAPAGPRIATQNLPYVPGTGVVQSVAPAPASGEPLSVLAIRMDDGRMQYIDTASNVPVGARVQLTPDHKIIVQ
jgi:hypothetical protein